MMIKKYLLYVLVLSVAVLSLQSCITDDSTSPSGNSSKLSLSQDLHQKYTLDRWDTLKIAPKVVQTNAQKNVSYEWEINKRVVSTDAQLNYVCEEFGVFPCRLKVSNGDNVQFYEFELNVQYSYVAGLYILASHGGASRSIWMFFRRITPTPTSLLRPRALTMHWHATTKRHLFMWPLAIQAPSTSWTVTS